MNLRYCTLIRNAPALLLKITCLVFLLLPLCPARAQNKELKELKKEADQRFTEENYDGAYKLYSQLVSNYPKDPVYNFRLGVCMIYAEPDKSKALQYLTTAAATPEEAPEETEFYLGRACHINYRFDEAIQHYRKFKSTAPQKVQKKLQVDRAIAACQNGKYLLSQMRDLVVLSKKVLNEADYFRSYELRGIGGKLLKKPDDFKTSLDKKKGDKSVIFLPRSGNEIFFSSYGARGEESGRDIYTALRQPGGKFSEPIKVSGINTEYDEDYPFLHPDGKTLYFASKGHNSMGGYDIFKTTWNEAAGTWGKPVNLEFPINSPDDDYLFVTDSLGETAFFSTGRQSPPGKIDVLKISTERKPIDVLVITGTVEPETDQQSVESTITIRDLDSNKNVSILNADPNGNYSAELPNGAHLLYTVATPGIATQTHEMQLPLSETAASYRQKIWYEGGKLMITNDFDAPRGDENYKQYLKVIEKKARLEVNEGENRIETPLASKQPVETGEQETPAAPEKVPPAAVDNNALAKLAREDADEAMLQAEQIEKDAEEARSLGEKQKNEADKKLALAAGELNAARELNDAEEREQAMEDAREKLEAAKTEQEIAGKVTAFAQSLQKDAKLKREEADLQRQYADALDKVVVSANPAALKKLEDLRGRIETLSASVNSTDLQVQQTKDAIAERRQQADLYEQQNQVLREEISENNQVLGEKLDELKKTRKKSKRAELSAEIDNFRASANEKELELKDNEAELAVLQEEISALEKEIEIASSLRSGNAGSTEPDEDTPVAATPAADPDDMPVTQNSVATTPPSEKTTAAATGDAISASNPKEATEQLERLQADLSADQNTPSPPENFSDPEAQRLSEEGQAMLADISAAENELKNAVANAQSVLSAQNVSDATRRDEIIRSADQLLAEAQGLRSEAAGLNGAAREKKLEQARNKEADATEKMLEASELTSAANAAEFKNAEEKLLALLNAGDGTASDLEEARSLSGEASLAFRQAAEIRMEGQTLSSSGARLGSMSNAEEREAEALLKQRRALELLDPSVANAPEEDILSPARMAEIQKVNTAAARLSSLKLAMYEKASDAAALEIVSLSKAKDNSPETDALIAEAAELKQETAKEPSTENYTQTLQKQNAAIAALKQQKEQAGLAGTPEEMPQEEDGAVPVLADEPEETAEKSPPAETDIVQADDPDIEETPSVEPPSATGTTVLATFIRDQTPEIKNPQAKKNFEKALRELDEIEQSIGSAGQNNRADGDPETLRGRSDALFDESSQLADQALNAQLKAGESTGSEKEKLLADAKSLENRSQEKMIESAALMKQANALEIGENERKINLLLARQKSDEPAAAQNNAQELEEIGVLHKQAQEIRTEAEGLQNVSQQLGAISNAEEKEAEFIQRQAQLLSGLTKEYPDFEFPPATVAGNDNDTAPTQELLMRRENALTALTNAINLEFEAKKNTVSDDPAMQATRKLAFDNNAQSKQLLVEAMRENNRQEKIAKLEQAARIAGEGLASLDKITVEPEEQPEEQPAVPEVDLAQAPSTTPETTREPGSTASVEGLEVIRGNAYNAERPIPVDATIGNGLLFRVQIGAFKNRLPNDAFKGLSPLNGETTASGYIRYTAGNFNKIGNANAVKNDLRKLGYSDAFVVAYFNGQRITLGEAIAILQREGQSVEQDAPLSAGITANANIPKPRDEQKESPVSVTSDLDRTEGLLYTVQIGVYNRQVTSSQLLGLLPVYREQLNNGLFRYTAGIYNDPERVLRDKQKVVGLGIRDAFVSAYINGTRVPFAEARQQQLGGETLQEMAEDPIVFPGSGNTTGSDENTTAVAAYPRPTPENGVKTTASGITYKVQIGAYSKQVPPETEAQFAQIKNWPVEYKEVNNLFIYTVGSFSELRFARSLKDNVVKLGFTDAFVAVYRDGKKLYGAAAAELLAP